MILQRLVEHYDRLAADPQWSHRLPRQGYSVQKISFCVVLEADGTLQQFQSMLDDGARRPRPQERLVPGQAKPSGSGINPGFLWDNAAYMLGYKANDPKPERTRQSFEAFRDRHLAIEAAVRSPAFSAVCTFLRQWSPEAAAEHATVLDGIVGHFGIFRIAGELRFVHEEPAVAEFWSRSVSDEDVVLRGECLVSGGVQPIARLHEPKIKGVPGAQTAGALLVSFNDDAYTSFGREQSYNAPVGASAVFKYANALNHLLARNERRVQLGDSTFIFWAERPVPFEEVVSELWGDAPPPGDVPQESRRTAEQVRLLLSQLREGHGGVDATEEDRTGFYVLGLSPNAARLSVRFWGESTVGEMKARLAQHMSDLELVGARENEPPLTVRRILQVAGRAETDASGRLKGYDAGAVPPTLAGALARAVITGGPYPQMLLAAMVGRLRSDGVVSHPRIAAIKACLVRNSRLNGEPKEVPVALDIERTDTAYVTGRLFALLEQIQSASVGGELSATIRDRYFSAASCTPGVVFPRLLRLGQHHLAKLPTGQRIFYEKQLDEVMGKLDGFASHLGLEAQGMFAVGYFHQRQDLYTSKKPKGGDAE